VEQELVSLSLDIEGINSHETRESENDIHVDVSHNFQIEITVDGSAADLGDLVTFDTGSQEAWLFDSRVLETLSVNPRRGGYRTQTLVAYGHANNGTLSYSDGTSVCIDGSTETDFSIGKEHWRQSFSVCGASDHAYADFTNGVIGASPKSEFVKRYPVFSFRPATQLSMILHFGKNDDLSLCHHQEMIEF
jgi:hypothetical protein